MHENLTFLYIDYGNLSTIALSVKDPVSVKERRVRFLQAMKSLCESHNDIWTLMTALELPVSDWEDKWIDVYLDISSKLLDICNAFSSELSHISVSKVAKILTKFVSANNSASHVINAYHHRASASFNELKQLHKELGSSHSHKKHKRHRTKNGNDSGKVVGNSVQSVDINKELSLGHVKFDQFKRQQSGSGNADQDDENFSQQLDGFIGYQIENVDEGEMHKKKKKKKQEVESLHDIDSTVKFGVREADGKLPNGSQKESESTREQGNEGNINAGMEEGRKQKSGKKHKVSTSSFSSYKGEANNGKDLEQQKEMEKTSCNGFEGENGGLGSSQDLQIKKKKNHNLDSASSKQYLQACSLLDDWRQHVSSRNPRIEKCVEAKLHDESRLICFKDVLMITKDDDKRNRLFQDHDEDQVNLCLMTKSDENNKEDSVRKKWYIDSGCSKHMTGDVSKFTTISPKKSGHVTYGDNNKGKIIGVGKIGTSSSTPIENVLLVEGSTMAKIAPNGI
ncbi:Protein BPS1, chloroplastic [Glycine soja]|uniref:Protein BPS1, chloroplastic n=1 Tax=Glycine soja TaxID=3848 RepID=A0A445H4F7_GLYSO|nr:Protein BPS1, chloroplastic [Glycine soja]